MKIRIMTMGGLVWLALIVLFSEANGQFKSGNELYQYYLKYKAVKVEGAFESGFFMGYCTAVADILDKIIFDIPTGETGVTIGQVVDIFGKYLENHPELRHLSASKLCADALKEAFPKKKDEAPGAGGRRPPARSKGRAD